MKVFKFLGMWYLTYLVGATMGWFLFMNVINWFDVVSAPPVLFIWGMISLFACIANEVGKS